MRLTKGEFVAEGEVRRMADKMDSREIAKAAGVSRSTVSRVLNNPEIVKIKTRQKVLDVIAQFSYTPNLSAQLLSGKKSRTIGLFITTAQPMQHQIEDAHMDYILRCILSSASIRDYHTLVTLVFDPEDPNAHGKILEMFKQNRVEGGIFVGFRDNHPVIEELVAGRYVVGIFDYDITGKLEPNRIVVNFDDLVGESAVDYFVSLGHRDIAAVHGDTNRFNGRQKHDAFLRGMKKNALPVRKEWMLYGGFDGALTARLIDQMLQLPGPTPSAIFATNDGAAFAAIQALNGKGLRVPDDISIIGVDDAPLSKYYFPPLTTFRVNFKQMLDILVGKVIDAVGKPFEQQFVSVFGAIIVERGSCKRR